MELYTLSVKILPFIHLLSWLQCNLLNYRLLENQHHVVIAVVIAYHPRVLRKRSKMMSNYFVNTVKRYVTSHASCEILPSFRCSFPTFPSFRLLMCISTTALQLLQSKQYCGICKKIWHHTDGGNWVRA